MSASRSKSQKSAKHHAIVSVLEISSSLHHIKTRDFGEDFTGFTCTQRRVSETKNDEFWLGCYSFVVCVEFDGSDFIFKNKIFVGNAEKIMKISLLNDSKDVLQLMCLTEDQESDEYRVKYLKVF